MIRYLTLIYIYSRYNRSYNYLNQLFEEDQKWIEYDSRAIIYINFGKVPAIQKRSTILVFG